MSNLIDEDGNENKQPELIMSVYDSEVPASILERRKRIVEAEEKHKDEIAKLNTLIDKLAEEIRRNSGDCKFCELNDHCPRSNNYDHDFCPTPVLIRYNILKHFTK